MKRTLVWDVPTRLFHWSLVACFVIAWLTDEGDRWRAIHVFVGYLMLGLVAFRVIWGVAGSPFSRFSSFWFGPRAALDYALKVLGGHAPRYVGHNPAGSVAIYILLVMAVIVGITGVFVLGGDERHGLATAVLTFDQARWAKKLHEAGAMLMLLVVLAHVTGVVVESRLHKENLAKSMVVGYKDTPDDTPGTQPRWRVAGVLALAMSGFGGWWFHYAFDRVVDGQGWLVKLESDAGQDPHVRFVGEHLPDHKIWRDECGSCHGVFHPTLLPRRSWEKLMATQDQHFGSDLGLDAATIATVLKFMVDNAAESHLTEAAFKIGNSIAVDQTPLRITETPYWVKKHRDITAADWANPKVHSKSNCAACHADADAGTFEDGAMHLPQ